MTTGHDDHEVTVRMVQAKLSPNHADTLHSKVFRVYKDTTSRPSRSSSIVVGLYRYTASTTGTVDLGS